MHTSGSLIVKLSTTVKKEGFGSLFSKAYKKLIYRDRCFVYTKYDLHVPLRKFKSSKRWRIGEFTREELPLCDTHFKRHVSDYKDLFDDGVKAFAAYEAETNNIIGVIWHASSDFYDRHYLHYKFKVLPHQILQLAGEISLPYRNTQVSVNLMQFGYDYWVDHGKDEVFCYTDVENEASLRLQFHLDWEEIGELVHFHRLLGYKWQTTEVYPGERFAYLRKKKRDRNKGE